MEEVVSLIIDDKKIFAANGTTILEAARQNGIQIPTLCYHPRLEPLGHCRICLVSVAGMSRPITSCDNPVTEGMIVKTTGPELENMRSEVLELFLATHPYKDCLTCVRTGSCELQDRSYQHQVDLPGQLERNIPPKKADESLLILRDEEKCILCGRCIQVCRSGPGKAIYGMIGRGVNTRVVPYRNGREVSYEEAGCIFCGQCIDVCPVAALVEKGRPSGGREWQLVSTPGVCIECSLGCYLERKASGDSLVKVAVPQEGEKASWLCRKGKFGYLESAEDPAGKDLLKKDKSIQGEAAYNEAVEEAAVKLIHLKEKYGPESLAVLASGRLSNEECFLLQKLAREIIATVNIDLGAEPAWVKTIVALRDITGLNALWPIPPALRDAGAVFVVGSGLDESHPVAAMILAQAGRFGRTAIIRTEAAHNSYAAWEELIVRPGKGGYKKLFEELAALLLEEKGGAAGSVKKVSRSAGLKKAAALLAENESITVVSPSFFAAADDEDIAALVRMAVESNQVRKGKSSLMLLSRFSNSSGVLHYGGTTFFGPGFSDLENKGGLGRDETAAALEKGRIKGLLLFGDAGGFYKFREKAYFVAADSDHAGHNEANIFFPLESSLNKEGYFINAAGQLRHNRPYAPGQKTSIQGWRLVCDLAAAMGGRWKYGSLEDVREEMKGLVHAAPGYDLGDGMVYGK